jgi:hypothetical protein
MNGRCDKCKTNTMTTQQILGYIICAQCAEELRRMVSHWVNAVPAPKESARRTPLR